MRALLDVNVLVALLDEDHTHHATAFNWLDDNIADGWASCPLTQNGCVRILSQPRYPGASSVADAIIRLRTAVSTPHHRFVADNVSLLDGAVLDHRRLSGPRRLTDAYLLALAVENACRLVTLDRSIPVAAVRRADAESLVVIGDGDRDGTR